MFWFYFCVVFFFLLYWQTNTNRLSHIPPSDNCHPRKQLVIGQTLVLGSSRVKTIPNSWPYVVLSVQQAALGCPGSVLWPRDVCWHLRAFLLPCSFDFSLTAWALCICAVINVSITIISYCLTVLWGVWWWFLLPLWGNRCPGFLLVTVACRCTACSLCELSLSQV